MEIVYVTLGILLRLSSILQFNFSKENLKKVGISLFAGAFVAVGLETMLAFPLGLVAGIAILFRDKLIPNITESLFLFYSVLAVFIYLESSNLSVFNISIEDLQNPLLATLVIVMLLGALLVAIPRRPNLFSQAILSGLFFALSAYVGYELSFNFLFDDTSVVHYLLLGYLGLTIASNLMYLIALMPIPYSKEQSFKERWSEVILTAKYYETRYSDGNAHYVTALMLITIGAALLLVDLPISWSLLAGGMLVIAQPASAVWNSFTKRHIVAA